MPKCDSEFWNVVDLYGGIMDPLPAHVALLLIDVQQGFSDPVWGPRNNPGAETNIVRLLAAWRATGRPIVHVHHDSSSPEDSFMPGTPGHAPKPEALPLADEPVHHKTVNSGFIGTNLEHGLLGAGIDTLVIVGLTTQHCVSTTTRMAGNLGFHTYVVSDATATFDQIGIDGQRRAAEDVHYAALSDLNEEFATVVDTETVLNSLMSLHINS
jgi:nicotinamidase-related amidase